MRKSNICLYVLGLAVVTMAALVGTSLVVSAQNSNSSSTTTATKKPKRKPAKATGRCDPNKGEQTDLSGTYTGKVKHGDAAAEDATLTITGNNFTINSGSETHSGRVTAVTTCDYIGVTMMMGDMTPPAPGATPAAPNKAISLRAKKVGDSLSLTSVPGEPEQVSFKTAGGAKPKTKHRTKKPATTSPAPPPKQ